MTKFSRNDCLQCVGSLDVILPELARGQIPTTVAESHRLAARAAMLAESASHAREVIRFLIHEMDTRAMRTDRLSDWADANDSSRSREVAWREEA